MVSSVVSAVVSSAYREVSGSSLTVGTGVSVVNALLRVRAYTAPRFTQPNIQEIVHDCSDVSDK